MPMRLFACAFFVAASALSARAQYVDSVTLTTGKAMEGEIQKLTSKEISLVLPGTTSLVTVQRDQVVGEISWDESSIPPAMNNGRSQFASGQYAAAAANFLKAYQAGGTRNVLKQECAYKMAEAYRLSGNFGEAATAYQKLLTDFPESFYIKEAYSAIVDCFMFSSPPNFAGARQYIGQISAKAKDLGISEEFVGELKLKDARMYERQNQPAQAQGVYNSLTNSKTPRIQWAAVAGLGVCQLAAKELDKARASFKKVIDNADRSQSQTLGRAYNGLGECYLAAGLDAANVKEALFCFLRTVTLYLPGANDLVDDHARAMMMGARCFFALEKLEANQEQKDKYGLEGQKLAARFRDTYGGDFPNWVKAIQDPLVK
ncbi:MAG: tetratricopeptide repeat protein [Planctomycetia bacterium]|nr:tetratricopeptide repeat protein [Planctomycetia bacterium]